MTRILRPLSFIAGLAVGAAVTGLLDRPSPEGGGLVPAASGESLGAMPRSREHAAVLSWIFQHRSDASDLEFLTWSAPTPVAENPFTDGPATLVQLVVKNKSTPEESLERLSFYLCSLEVLGSVSQAHVDVKATTCV